MRRLRDIFLGELRRIFGDPTIVVLFFVGTLVYPLLYSWIYNNEVLRDMPVAVVDLDRTSASRELVRRLDATPEVATLYHCPSMAEARARMNDRKAHGIVLIPEGMGEDLERGEQTVVSVYADMSSFLYYKGLLSAANFTVQTLGGEIQVKRLVASGVSPSQAIAAADPVPSIYMPLYNEGGGYAGFLIPAVLILIIHQTLLLGICILAGAARERKERLYIGSPILTIIGKAMAYFASYFVLMFYVLVLVPRWFGLPHSQNIVDIYLFLTPFLLAVIFMAMGISCFFRERETPMLLLLFLSVPLLFLSGVAWPLENMPVVWRGASWLLPSTSGVQGFVKISSMGASLPEVRREYITLWIQCAAYFGLCLFAFKKTNRL